MRYSYKGALLRLVDYAVLEGYEVDINSDGISEISWNLASLNEPLWIKIQGSYNWELRVYLMLHELGHHELRKDWDVFSKRLPLIASIRYNESLDNGYKRVMSEEYKVSCLEEEYLAWGEGLRLGLSMGIRINMVRWGKMRTSCLGLYIEYYGKNSLKKLGDMELNG